jgi:hypothetical protein
MRRISIVLGVVNAKGGEKKEKEKRTSSTKRVCIR